MRADFGAAMSLLHGYNLLSKHGPRAALPYFEEVDSALRDPGADAAKKGTARRVALESRDDFVQFMAILRQMTTGGDMEVFPKLAALEATLCDHFGVDRDAVRVHG